MLFSNGYSTNHLDLPALLWLYHSTMAHTVDLITASDQLNTQRASISTVFFFYGKPSYSYRPKANRFQPFSFVFSGDKVVERGDYVSIHCFDTGAISHGLYQPDVTPDEPVDNFALGRTNNDLRLACRELFETNLRYLNGSCRKPAEFGAFCTAHLESYLRLVGRTADLQSPSSYDPPAHTFEIQAQSPVRLSANAIGLLGPQDELYRLTEFAEECGIELIPYGSDEKLSGFNGWMAMIDRVKDISNLQ